MPRPTPKNLQQWFDPSRFDLKKNQLKDLSKRLYAAEGRPKAVDRVLGEANDLLSGFGVEAVRGNYHVDNHYYEIVGLYVNMGDTYNATILYDTDRQKFYVTSWGDWVEQNQERYQIS
jgi:hypothetical protein